MYIKYKALILHVTQPLIQPVEKPTACTQRGFSICCGPGLVECTSTLPERILSLSTSSIISSPRGYPMVNFGNGNQMGNPQHPSMDPPEDAPVLTTIIPQACLRPKQHDNKHQARLLTTRMKEYLSNNNSLPQPQQGRLTLSVPACSEVVCRVGEHQHRWYIVEVKTLKKYWSSGEYPFRSSHDHRFRLHGHSISVRIYKEVGFLMIIQCGSHNVLKSVQICYAPSVFGFLVVP